MRKPFITVRLTYGMLGALLVSTCACSGTKWTEVEKDSIRIVTQQEGAVLGYSANSGVRLLAVDGYAFKDLNRNGLLDPYEDWRLTPEERAVDLAGQLSTEEIAGLMLYSAHQSIPGASKGFGASTYNGKSFDESGAQPSDLSDAQRKLLTEDNVRHVLVTRVQSPEVVARWNNNVQALVEGSGHGILRSLIIPMMRISPSSLCRARTVVRCMINPIVRKEETVICLSVYSIMIIQLPMPVIQVWRGEIRLRISRTVLIKVSP